MTRRVPRHTSLFLLITCAFLASCTVIRVTRPVIKIGLVGPFEGQYRYVGYDAIYGARLALREANATGGVGGYVVELVAYNDEGTITGARRAVRNLALDSQMVAVVGHYRDETTEAARVIYEWAGLPVIVAGTVEGGVSGRADLLCLVLDYLKESVIQSKADNKLTAHRVQWIAADDGQPAFTCADGMTIVASAQVPPPPNVEIVLLTLDPVLAGETLKALREAGWNGVVAGGPTLGSPLFMQVTDPSGVIFFSPYRWPEIEGRDSDFSAAYQSIGPHVPRPGPFALTTYQAVQELLATVGAATCRGEAATRQTLSQHSIQLSTTIGYLYRWTPAGTLELVKEANVSAEIPPEVTWHLAYQAPRLPKIPLLLIRR